MTTGTISPWPLIRKGDQQHPVKTLQYLLRARGHNVTADGIFGPNTDAAVRAFQQQKGLAVDGIVGPNTWSALIITVKQGSQGDAVRGSRRSPVPQLPATRARSVRRRDLVPKTSGRPAPAGPPQDSVGRRAARRPHLSGAVSGRLLKQHAGRLIRFGQFLSDCRPLWRLRTCPPDG